MPASLHRLQAEIFKALAHPSRLLILEALYRKEESFSSLLEITGLMKSNLSQQLSILQGSGLILCNKRGLNKYYSLYDSGISEVIHLINGQLRMSISRQETALSSQLAS